MSYKLTQRQLEVLNLIKQTIEKTGIPPTRAEIAKELGFKSPNAAEDHIKALTKKGALILNPGASRGIRLNPEFIVETFPDVSTKEEKTSTQHSSFSSFLKEAKALTLHLPLIGRVAAGYPIDAIEHHEETLQVDTSLFSSRPDYLLKVSGLSMKDIGIMDGDLIAVKKTESVRNGQIVVARIDEEVTVKRFEKKGSNITLFPENEEFSPIIVDKTREFAIEGIVVGLIRTQWH